MVHQTQNRQPLPLITELDIRPPDSLLKLAEDTRVALEILNYAAKSTDSPKALVEMALLQEALDSCTMDGISVPLDDVYKRMVHKRGNEEVSPILNCKEAMHVGWERMRDRGAITLGELDELCQQVSPTTGIRTYLPGFGEEYRISVRTEDAEEFIYTPPQGKDLLWKHLLELFEFLYNDEAYGVHPLIKIALAHVQFARFSPYREANGRIGRILNVLWICHRKYLNLPILCASSYLHAHHQKYHEVLYAFHDDDYLDNLYSCAEFMLKSWLTSAKQTLRVVEQVKVLYRECSEESYLGSFKGQFKLLRKVVDILFQKDYVRIADLVNNGIHRQTAAGYLNRFEEKGLLKKLPVGKDNIYINIKLQALFEKLNKEVII